MCLLKPNPSSGIWRCLWVIWVEFDPKIYRGGRLRQGWLHSGTWVAFQGHQNVAARLCFAMISGGKGLVEVGGELDVLRGPRWSLSHRRLVEQDGRCLVCAWGKKRERCRGGGRVRDPRWNPLFTLLFFFLFFVFNYYNSWVLILISLSFSLNLGWNILELTS